MARSKETHARIRTRGRGWTADGSSALSLSLSLACLPRRHGWIYGVVGLRTRAHLVHSPAHPVHAGDSVPRRTLVPACRLGQVFNGHVITSSCVHHPAEWTTRSYNAGASRRHRDRPFRAPPLRSPSPSPSASSSSSRHDAVLSGRSIGADVPSICNYKNFCIARLFARRRETLLSEGETELSFREKRWRFADCDVNFNYLACALNSNDRADKIVVSLASSALSQLRPSRCEIINNSLTIRNAILN